MYTGPQIVTSGLVMHLDAGNTKSMIDAPSTNLLLRSQEIQYWSQYQVTTTTNTITAPDGTLTGDTNTETNALTGNRGIQQQFITTSSSLYTFSIYAKYNGRNMQLAVFEYPGYINYYFANFNLQTGAISSTFSIGNGVFASTSITSAGNGWYRCSVSGKLVGTQSQANINFLNASNASSYTGNGTSGVYFWGGQFELGPPTVYIPTTTAAVSRLNCNDISKNGNSGSLVNGPTYDYSNKGGIILDGSNDYISLSGRILPVSSFTISFTFKLTNILTTAYTYFQNNGGYQTSGYYCEIWNSQDRFAITLSKTGFTTGANFAFVRSEVINKIISIVWTYDGTTIRGYQNGVLKVTTTATIVPDIPPININPWFGNLMIGNVYSILSYSRALSATEVLQNFNATRSRFGI